MRTRADRHCLELYIAVVVFAAVACVVLTVATSTRDAWLGDYPGLMWLFGGLLVFAELHPIKWLRRNDDGGEVTPSWAFAWALVLLAAPLGALAIMATSSGLGDLVQRKPVTRLLFNVSQLIVSLSLGRFVLYASGQEDALLHPQGPSFLFLIALLFGGGTVLLINGLLTSVALALHQRQPVGDLVRAGILSNLSTDLMLFGLSPAFVVLARQSPQMVVLLLATTWAVYRSIVLSLSREHEANHDPLTDLPNRRLFDVSFDAAMELAARRGAGLALMALDLNRFKEINDRLGHHIGDRVLQEAARRLLSAKRPADFVARLGGDEFAVIVRDVDDVFTAHAIAERLLTALEGPDEIDGLPITVRASAGLALFPNHGRDRVDLLRHADLAMYKAKQRGGGVVLHAPSGDGVNQRTVALVPDLARALEDGQLAVHYQPCVEVDTGRMAGVEALIRWNHPEYGAIPPSEFIPVAEQTDLMEPLTSFVLEQAIVDCLAWHRMGWDLRVAVNGSSRSFHDLRFPDRVRQLLERHGLEPRYLELEITETSIVTDPERTAEVVGALRRGGVSVSIDDFGTGWSSLSILRDVPLDRLKIDKSFVTGMRPGSGEEKIVRSLIALAHSLGLETIAEGVEDAAVLDALREERCDLAQGYLLSRPVEAAVINVLLLDEELAAARVRR